MLQLQLQAVDAQYDAVKRFEYVPKGDDVEVWLIGSRYSVGSYKKQKSNARADEHAQSFDEGSGHSYERHSSSKTDKWLLDRADGKIPGMNVGEAATKFKNPNVHVQTVKILEQKAKNAVLNGPPFPSNYQVPWPITPGKK